MELMIRESSVSVLSNSNQLRRVPCKIIMKQNNNESYRFRIIPIIQTINDIISPTIETNIDFSYQKHEQNGN